ncbi:hypothetical protein GIB67_032936 [Kingdonia uniflora]|uniref:SAM domain-containing protein n=1 Tax=Kingdonia uniflora TaxID=39325 RepID=A0A7J7MYK7_9MAGN|nr:hypothetical protein GIB67_032936 [Kingdonia uniflora]
MSDGGGVGDSHETGDNNYVATTAVLASHAGEEESNKAKVEEFSVSGSYVLSKNEMGITYLGEETLTIASLLHALGLGEYEINFRDQEVDMTELKHMGDNDLKTLGIPMGPRKRILLAVLPPRRRQLH